VRAHSLCAAAQPLAHYTPLPALPHPPSTTHVVCGSDGYLVRDVSSGDPHFVKVAAFKAALLDLTNPRARTWMRDDVLRANLLGLAHSGGTRTVGANDADGWMADFGEAMPCDGVTLHDGRRACSYQCAHRRRLEPARPRNPDPAPTHAERSHAKAAHAYRALTAHTLLSFASSRLSAATPSLSSGRASTSKHARSTGSTGMTSSSSCDQGTRRRPVSCVCFGSEIR